MTVALADRAADFHGTCAARLRDCVDPRSGLFARQLRAGAWAPTHGTESLTGSAICLIGLGRAGIPPGEVVDGPRELCVRVAAGIKERGYPGGVGLALWAGSALRAAAPLALLAEAGLDPSGLERAVPGLTTMEAAWLASGLLHADHPGLRSARGAALRELEDRLDRGTTAFRHASAAAPWRHRLRARIANFADQVYPVQAFAFAAIALGDAARRGLADRCAARLAAAQGPLGQWWWHHDAATGRVAERYPVYSVHQHSMAPMALRCLSLAGGSDHAVAAARGRAWLRSNEIGADMAEAGSGVVWRSVERDEGPLPARLRHARMLLNRRTPRDGEEEAPPRLRLNREMRPYEWGWLLYATAIEGGGPAPAGHIA